MTVQSGHEDGVVFPIGDENGFYTNLQNSIADVLSSFLLKSDAKSTHGNKDIMMEYVKNFREFIQCVLLSNEAGIFIIISFVYIFSMVSVTIAASIIARNTITKYYTRIMRRTSNTQLPNETISSNSYAKSNYNHKTLNKRNYHSSLQESDHIGNLHHNFNHPSGALCSFHSISKLKIIILLLFYWTLEHLFARDYLIFLSNAVSYQYCDLFHNRVNSIHFNSTTSTTFSTTVKMQQLFCESVCAFLSSFPYFLLASTAFCRKRLHLRTILLLAFIPTFAVCICRTLTHSFASSSNEKCNLSMQRVSCPVIGRVAMLIGLALAPRFKIFIENKEKISNDDDSGEIYQGSYNFRGFNEKTNKQRNYPKENKYIHSLITDKEDIYEAKKDIFPPKDTFRSSRHHFSVRHGLESFIPCVVLASKNKTSKLNQIFSHSSTSGMHIGTAPMKVHQPHYRPRRRFSLDTEQHRIHVDEPSRNMRRRTSLPSAFLSSRKKIVMSSVLIETNTITEIQNVLRELLSLSSTSPEIKQQVVKLQKLLKPYQTDHLRPSQVVWLHDSLSAATSDGSDDEDMSRGIRQSFTKRPHKDWSTRDSSLWTTTTSATGLPSKDPGPVKPIRLPISKTPSTPRDSRCNSPICPSKDNARRGKSSHLLSPVTLSDDSGCHDNHHTDSSECDVINNHDAPPLSKLRQVMHDNTPPSIIMHQHQDYQDSLETDANATHLPNNGSKLRVLQPTINEDSEEEEVIESSVIQQQQEETDICPQEPDSGRLSANLENYHGECLFQNKYHGKLLEQVPNWNFPIFSLADKTHCVLSQMSYKLFDDTGLFQIFKIPRHLFVNYMRALENGYRNIPYHNRIHAADVLHGCWFLTTQHVPEFHERPHLFGSESSDSDSGTSTIQSERHQVSNIGHASLATAIPALELMALYLAAAMHDYDHPGRTNAFLVETRHPLAMLYNDRSVLENHHASASWELLHSRSDGSFDFLKHLKTAEWKRLRFLIVEAILATDLKKHFELMNKFMSRITKTRVSSESSEASEEEEIASNNGINWSKDEDRLLVCQMVIKLADISGPTKCRNLHVTWTKAICEEFFTQGDEERKLEVPLSLYMDRSEPKVAALQRTFIKNLIDPLVKAMHSAGILAGRCEEQETEYDSDDDSTPTHEVVCSSPSGATRNILLSQLSDNSRHWKLMEDRKLQGTVEMDIAFKSSHPVRLEHSGHPSLPILTANDDRFNDLAENNEKHLAITGGDKTISENSVEPYKSAFRRVPQTNIQNKTTISTQDSQKL